MILLFAIFLLFAAPSWGFDAAVTRVPINIASTGLQPITFTDFSEDCTAVPCAAIFVLTTATEDNTATGDALISLGFTDGTTQKLIMVHDNDGGSSSLSRREMRGDRVIQTYDGGVTGSAHFYDWQSNGLRLDVTDTSPGAFLLTVMIMGGTGFQSKAGTIAVNPAVDGTTDITEVGFPPDAVFLSGARLSTNGAADYVFSAGMAVNDGASTQGSIGCYSRTGLTTTDVHAVTSTLYASAFTDFGGLDMALLVDGWDASGFTTTTKVAGLTANHSYLALKFGGPESAVFDIDTRTSVGATSHSLGFRPLAGMVFGTLARAYDTDEADSDASQCMLSLFAGNGQYANTNSMEDALSTGPNTTSRSDDGGIMMGSSTGTCPQDGCLRGFLILDPTALTIDYSVVYNDAVRKWIGFAIEDEVGVLARRRGPGLLQ